MTGTTARGETDSSAFVCLLEAVVDENMAGGKAWNLSRMLRLGLPVPPGFVLGNGAFQQFLAENRLHEQITALSADIDLSDRQSLQNASRQIQAKIAAATVPAAVRAALREGYCKLGVAGTLIVRSSAVGEDSASSSFAGQLDSFRDITAEAGIEAAVIRCWASCWSERALYYQLSRGIRIAQMGVVVQEQVVSRVAGVLFTVSPDSSVAGDEMLCEYCFGHGEDLVSGRINPGRFTISRSGFQTAILAEPEQPDFASAKQYRLDDAGMERLQQIGLLLEREFQGAQDIEWAMDHDRQLHIVQSRPVTTIAPKAEAGGCPGAGTGRRTVIWSNANINENYPDPVSPFLYSIATDGYYHYFRNLARAFGVAPGRIAAMEAPLRGIIGAHCARLYYNLTNIHGAIRMMPGGDHLVDSFNLFVGASEVAAAESSADRRSGWLANIGGLCRIALKSCWQFFFLEKGVASFESRVDEYARRYHPRNLEGLNLAQLHGALLGFYDIRCHHWVKASLADVAAMIGYGLLKRLLGRAFPERENSALHNTLLQGLPDLISARPSSELWQLSRRILGDDNLRQLFATEDCAVIEEALRTDERCAGFHQELGEYLERWGFRCSGELMLTVKSFQEDPRGVLTLLKNYAALDDNSPTAALRKQGEDRLAETVRVLAILRRRKFMTLLPWPHEGTVLALVLRWTQGAVALRERARLKQSLLYSRCRRIMLRIGEELAAEGLLSRHEEVFFFTHQELTTLICGYTLLPGALKELVRIRMEEHARLGELTPPDSFTIPEGFYLSPEKIRAGQGSHAKGNPTEEMTGIGACGGEATARATVLADVSEAGRLTAGDILVTRQTDPGWAPIFFLVKGLVMERGGMLSHGAIIAREYGIPTVVGVHDATKKIPSGSTVTVNGDAGYVRLVD